MNPTLEGLLDEYGMQYPEESDTVTAFRELLRQGSVAFNRQNEKAHFTASGWIVDESYSQVLLVHHKKLRRWLQPGGHADGETDLYRVFLKEMAEETGIIKGRADRIIFDLDIHMIPEMGKINEHLHYDVRFLYVTPEKEQPESNEETNASRWVALDEVPHFITGEPSMVRMVNKTLKLKRHNE
jgi:8-oxo-dGTP pyrophosphatase MutT (NUDIX family)